MSLRLPDLNQSSCPVFARAAARFAVAAAVLAMTVGCQDAGPEARGDSADEAGPAPHVAADCNFGSVSMLPSDFTQLLLDIDLASKQVIARCPEEPDGCSLVVDEGEGLEWQVVAFTTFDDEAPVISEKLNETTVDKIFIAGSNGDDLEFTIVLAPNNEPADGLQAEAVLIVSDAQFLLESTAVTTCSLDVIPR